MAWCPWAAALFAAAAGNALQLWDVERSCLVPRAQAQRYGTRLTSLAFSQVPSGVEARGRRAPVQAGGQGRPPVPPLPLPNVHP